MSSAQARQTQLVVLGSGPGGYAAAFRAADLGLEVTLVERYPRLGGVCLNVGCIPSKALLHASRVIDDAAGFAEHGLRFDPPTIDLDALRGWKDGVVGRLTGGLAQLAKRRRVTVVHGEGRLRSEHSLVVEQAKGASVELQFEQAILAAGSRTMTIPGIPYDDDRVISSTGALELRDVPQRLLVIGGGIIGLEMATVYQALGSRVTVVELTDSLLPGVDSDLVRPLRRRIEPRYEAIHLSTRVAAVEAHDDALEARLEGECEDRVRFDRVLVAVGRRPNGDTIGAEAAGVEVDERGFVPVDETLRTNQPHIFAIGDLARPPMLAHKATHEGRAAAEVAAGEKRAFEALVVPSVAYTDPEIAWVGLTETEAGERGIEVGKGVFPWAANGRSLSLGRDEGMTKLLFDPVGERLLGAGIVGPNAGDLIAEAGLAIEMGCVAEDLALTVHAHPTLSETIGGAAEVFAGTATDLYAPARKRRPRE